MHVSGSAAALLVALLAAGCSGEAAEPSPAGVTYGRPVFLANLANRRVSESSGVACSRRTPGVFWTHNDSGGTAELFAFDEKGRDLGTFTLPGAGNRDWEDIASYSLGGKHYLILGDIGDNRREHKSSALYILEEPAVPAKKRPAQAELVRTIAFTFDGGPEDGEGLAVDPAGKTVFVAVRNYHPHCPIFALPLPDKEPAEPLVAKKLAAPKIRVGNAMDLSPDGRRAVVGSYWDAFEFVRREGETWKTALSRKPNRIKAPDQTDRPKGEGVCYGADGRTLYLTSEGSPCPVWKIPPKETTEVGR